MSRCLQEEWLNEAKMAKCLVQNNAVSGLQVVLRQAERIARSEIKVMIQKNGGKVVSNISRKTSYLVMGEKPGSKFVKARELDIPILDESGLLGLIDTGDQT